jgi:hypothetical protein
MIKQQQGIQNIVDVLFKKQEIEHSQTLEVYLNITD